MSYTVIWDRDHFTVNLLRKSKPMIMRARRYKGVRYYKVTVTGGARQAQKDFQELCPTYIQDSKVSLKAYPFCNGRQLSPRNL